ncbi:MAG: very short patch repair endonuclease [Armatimonadetes bacterium]|nr:very short patch repair endonuclease [Armatimonadota bacterium]
MSGPRDKVTTSRIMSRVRSKDSRVELALRRELHARGLRFRLHARDVVGTPDLVWRGLKVAVFLDGDMWHGNEHRLRGLASLSDLYPSNTEFWVKKIEANIARDREVTEALISSGWSVVRIWASDAAANLQEAADRVVSTVERARQSASATGQSRTPRG